MKGKTYHHQPDDLIFYKYRAKEVKRNNIFRMQHMESDTTAPGMKDRGGQQMIQIHQHGCQQDQVIFLPPFVVIPVSDSAYEDEVKEVMDKGLEQCVPGLEIQNLKWCKIGRIKS